MKNKQIFIIVILAMLLSSCVAVSGYQRAFLNDSDMELDGSKLESYEVNFQNYRESSVGGTNGKTGGGCGCN